MDRINRHYGRGTLRTGAEELTEDWRMRQDNAHRAIRPTGRSCWRSVEA
ncbi:DUF4113 domain-containing protein [Crenobacter oryzisoli]